MRIDPKNKIDGAYDPMVRQSAALEKAQKDADIGAGSKGGLSADRVELSKTGADYSEVSAISKAVADDIEKGAAPERIRALKARIESGEYHVSSRDIASAMLNPLNKTDDA